MRVTVRYAHQHLKEVKLHHKEPVSPSSTKMQQVTTTQAVSQRPPSRELMAGPSSAGCRGQSPPCGNPNAGVKARLLTAWAGGPACGRLQEAHFGTVSQRGHLDEAMLLSELGVGVHKLFHVQVQVLKYKPQSPLIVDHV